MKRRTPLILCLSLVLALLIPGIAFADESDSNRTPFSPELAVQFAQDFADSIYPDEELTASTPLIFFDENGNALGYIVSFKQENTPYGYIIYDTSDPSLLSEYVVEEGIANPFINENRLSVTASKVMSSDTNAIVKIGSFTYAAVNPDTDEAITNYGDTISVSKNTLDSIKNNTSNYTTRSNNPVVWNDIFVDIDTGKYNTYNSKFVTTFLGKGRSEDKIREISGGKYACAVVALMDCAEYYDPNFSSKNQSDIYWGISNATNTKYSGNQGSIYDWDMGSGFTSYLKSQGVTLQSSSISSPTWNNYYNSINSWNMSTFNCHIPGYELGHAMSVQGYRILDPLPSGNLVYTLCVHDGWTEAARYVNFNFSNYSSKFGVFFS